MTGISDPPDAQSAMFAPSPASHQSEFGAAGPPVPSVSTILVVDDDPDHLEMLERVLQAAGYLTVSAGSGYAADEIVRRLRPAAAIVDLMLPDVSGLELLHRWRTNWWMGMQEVPVVVLSGRSEDEDCAAAEALGAALYLVKPVDPADVAEHVRDLLLEQRPQLFRSPLSGLPGASALAEAVRRRQDSGRPWAMLTLKLVGLTALNERCGYKKGDQAIRMLAAVISAGHGNNGAVYHVSGGLFAQLLDQDALDSVAAAAFDDFALFRTWFANSNAAGPALPPGTGPELVAAGMLIPAHGHSTLAQLQEVAGGLLQQAKLQPGRLLKRAVE